MQKDWKTGKAIDLLLDNQLGCAGTDLHPRAGRPLPRNLGLSDVLGMKRGGRGEGQTDTLSESGGEQAHEALSLLAPVCTSTSTREIGVK